MTQDTFSIRLEGIGQSEEAIVLRNLAALFKCEPEQVKTLLQTPGHLVKKGIDQETAQRYKQAIESAGARCEIVAETGPETVQATPHSSASSFTCPHCSAVQEADSRFCSICGQAISNPSLANEPDPVQKAEEKAEASKVWWYSVGNQRFGPVSPDELKAALKPGEIASCLVWQEGMTEWQPILAIPTLKTILPEPLSVLVPSQSQNAGQPQIPNPGNPGFEGMIGTLLEHLAVVKDKINVNQAFLGIVSGFCVYAFSLFLTWARIPDGMLARDGGATSGWSEHAYLAIIPLIVALYPVLLKQAVRIRPLLINIGLAFVLLAYNNIVNRTTWAGGYFRQIEMGSDLGVGFWLDLLALLTISVCGIAWSFHTTAPKSD